MNKIRCWTGYLFKPKLLLFSHDFLETMGGEGGLCLPGFEIRRQENLKC